MSQSQAALREPSKDDLFIWWLSEGKKTLFTVEGENRDFSLLELTNLVHSLTGYRPEKVGRRKEQVQSRRLFIFLVELFMKVGCYHLGKLLSFNHASIIHHRRKFFEELEINDKQSTDQFRAICGLLDLKFTVRRSRIT